MLAINQRTLLGLLFFFSFPTGANAQAINFDSLYFMLDTSTAVQEQIRIHIKIGAYKKFSNESEATYHMDRALFLADSIGDMIQFADGLYYKSIVYGAFAKYERSISLLDSLEMVLDSEHDKLDQQFINERRLWMYQSKSFAYIYTDRVNEAIDMRFKVLDIIPEVYELGSFDYKLEFALNYAGLGRIYQDRDDLKALGYFRRALSLYKQIDYHPSYQFDLLISIAGCYMNLHRGFTEIDATLDSAYSLLGDYGSTIEFSNYFRYKCALYSDNNRFVESQEFCNQALELGMVSQDSLGLSNIHYAMGYNYLNLGDPNLAVEHFNRFIDYSSSFGSSQFLNQAICKLAEAHTAAGNFQTATMYWQRCRDTLEVEFQNTLSAKFTEAEAIYETSQKEAEIANQKLIITQQRGQRNLLLIGGVLGLLLIGSLFYGVNQRTRRKRRESELALKIERERNENLEELNRIKTDFFNNVSHELRTPLTMIIAPLREALTRIKHVDIKRDLNFALLSSNRLLYLTNEILDLSKLESGQEEINESAIHLHSFLSRVFGAFDSLAKSQQIRLIKNFKIDQDISISTDPSKLEKICNNLMSNAIKFTDTGSSVQIDAHIENGNLELSVTDEGPGILDSEKEIIFNRFYQGRDSNKSSGTGIGLSLVKEICLLLGGDITAENGSKNGCVFKVVLPVQPVSMLTPVENEPDNEEYSIINSKISLDYKPVMLIVEDDMEMSKYLVSLFESDFDCEVAYNGIQGMDKLKSHSIDIITSDIMMPSMDGFEFRDKVNKDGRWKSIPFIMLTARSLEEDKIKGLRMGVDDYITKPFSVDEIKARVNNLLKNKQVRKISREEEPEATVDEKILENAKELVSTNIDDSNYKVGDLAKDLNYSKRQLARIMKRVAGMTPVEFLLEIRLQQAYRIISERRFATINEVRHKVGIESASYFSKKFKERFGVSPGAVAQVELF